MVGSSSFAISEIERIREKLKSEAQLELNQKLQEVNRYLDEQAKARERLDRIRDINETEMRMEFEKVRKEMLVRELFPTVRFIQDNFNKTIPTRQCSQTATESLKMKLCFTHGYFFTRSFEKSHPLYCIVKGITEMHACDFSTLNLVGYF